MQRGFILIVSMFLFSLGLTIGTDMALADGQAVARAKQGVRDRIDNLYEDAQTARAKGDCDTFRRLRRQLDDLSTSPNLVRAAALAPGVTERDLPDSEMIDLSAYAGELKDKLFRLDCPPPGTSAQTPILPGKPVDQAGGGFYYIPGTDICIRVPQGGGEVSKAECPPGTEARSDQTEGDGSSTAQGTALRFRLDDRGMTSIDPPISSYVSKRGGGEGETGMAFDQATDRFDQTFTAALKAGVQKRGDDFDAQVSLLEKSADKIIDEEEADFQRQGLDLRLDASVRKKLQDYAKARATEVRQLLGVPTGKSAASLWGDGKAAAKEAAKQPSTQKGVSKATKSDPKQAAKPSTARSTNTTTQAPSQPDSALGQQILQGVIQGGIQYGLGRIGSGGHREPSREAAPVARSGSGQMVKSPGTTMTKSAPVAPAAPSGTYTVFGITGPGR